LLESQATVWSEEECNLQVLRTTKIEADCLTIEGMHPQRRCALDDLSRPEALYGKAQRRGAKIGANANPIQYAPAPEDDLRAQIEQ